MHVSKYHNRKLTIYRLILQDLQWLWLGWSILITFEQLDGTTQHWAWLSWYYWSLLFMESSDWELLQVNRCGNLSNSVDLSAVKREPLALYSYPITKCSQHSKEWPAFKENLHCSLPWRVLIGVILILCVVNACMCISVYAVRMCRGERFREKRKTRC